MPESSGECETPLRRPELLNPSRSSRRHLLCAECHKQFRTLEELYIHSEVCIIESFENEAVSVFSSMPSLTESTAITLSTHSGITAKGDGPPKLIPESDVPIKASPVISKAVKTEESGKRAGTMSAIETLRPKRKSFDLKNARTIEGSNGLKLYVSIEKEPVRGNDVGASEDDDQDNGYESPQTSGVPNPMGKVIGALANADDDDGYRPKMECPTCGLVLYRHNFSTHYRIHTGELPFMCSYCQKRFRTTSALKVHIRAHTGEKPYSCPKCSYCCITKRNLDRHIINNHVREGERRGPRERRSRYRCDEYSLLVNDMEIGVTEDAENEKTDHHYVVTAEELLDTDVMKAKASEDETAGDEQSSDMPVLPLLT